MKESKFTFVSDADGLEIAGASWMPEGDVKAAVQIAHGLAEHGARYRRFAEALTSEGFVVYANDHRGHGRTLGEGATPGDFGEAGWAGLVADVAQLTRRIHRAHPGAPVVLFGHSMGSFAAQNYLLDHGGEIDACILSGSSDLPSLAQLAMSGEDLSFEAFNAAFAPARTPFDWLSRDEREVDVYMEDPLCGFDAPPETAMGMMSAAARLADPEQLKAVAGDLPILIVSGSADPLCAGGALVETLAGRFGDAGFGNVALRLYDDARHEVLNEMNREDITAAIIAWIKTAIAS